MVSKPAFLTSLWWRTHWKMVITAILFIIFPFIGGSIGGGVVTRAQIDTWYNLLNRPEWRPPNWLFGPVWAILYFCMGLGSFLVWKNGRITDNAEKELENAGIHPQVCYWSFSNYSKWSIVSLGMYLVNIALNWAWSPVFFVNHRVKDAFALIIVLDVIVLAMIAVSLKVTKGGFLFVPYL